MNGKVRLTRVDEMGIFSFPEGICAEDVSVYIIDGEIVKRGKYYVLDNGDVDLYESRPNSIVTALLK